MMKNLFFQVCKCEYCEFYNSFPVLWELTPNMFWFEIPKNGSYSTKRKYTNRVHITDVSKCKNISPFVILRDPISRFISLFKHYCIEGERRFHIGEAFYKRCGKDISTMNLSERLDFLINNVDKLTSTEEVHHFYPQSFFIDTTNFDNFNLINIKNVSVVFKTQSLNTTKKANVYLDTKQTQYINDIYKEDYEFFDKFNFKV